MKITNLLNRPRCFTLSNGKTLRMNPYEEVEVSSKDISLSLKGEETKGTIALKKKPVKKEVKKKDDKKKGDK